MTKEKKETLEQELIIELEHFRVHLPMRLRGLATEVVDRGIQGLSLFEQPKKERGIKKLWNFITFVLWYRRHLKP